jgi:hypothetical protein
VTSSTPGAEDARDPFAPFPALMVDMTQHLDDHGWSLLEVHPWRPTGSRARVLAQRDQVLVMVTHRPSYTPKQGYQQTEWRSKNARFYVQLKAETPWFRVPNRELFLTCTEGEEVELPERATRSGTPLEWGEPIVRCVCGKVQFTEEAAREAVANSERKRSRGNVWRQERRVYECPGHPLAWHVTSSERFHAPLRPLPASHGGS